METVHRDNCNCNLWLSRELRDITGRAERMQKKIKGYWGPVIHRQDASSGSKTNEEELRDGMDRLSESL